MRKGMFACVLALAACGGASGTTSPGASRLEMTSAQIVLAGQVLNGQTTTMYQGADPTRFEARLERAALPATGGTVYCRYDRPGSMGMHGQGTFMLYDDGTHGDRMPGDGLYCFEDDLGQYGCHGPGAGIGEYRYDFWGEHPEWGSTEHHGVTVTVR